MADPKPKPTVTPDDLPRRDERPVRSEVDWDAFADDRRDITPEEFEIADELTDFDDEGSEELTEEDDDNPYQESDEALPDDEEESAIRRQNRREAGDPV